MTTHDERDPWAEPKGYYACEDCGKPLPGRKSLVAHWPCVQLACKRCGHKLSNEESTEILRDIGYGLVDDMKCEP